ncbi:FAD dependent oxidoreductase [Dothidotthia symphoricarpi CBS 119687]|uniref:FAD dependent oxidoreductase n=1 Tax=Dothidotthia symphoricarpi CBS 119687 TaxID=1392245 RepID=A0A6A6ARJ8_9PLEO|nr:FAD dependent oxidoreductase [Dothidotthia symphoricarpi CBS 119687]KAF2133141.1 FAD dependent oxidoreductase [Dothidotthia symphoricarpi CBS 119687]
MASSASPEIPSSVLIVGSGAFGLSTAWALCRDPQFKNTAITVVDRQTFPTPDGSSIDTSRIIRPDYAAAPYTKLATIAQERWRTDFATEHYHQVGLCITASGIEQTYVSSSLHNVRAIGTDKIEVLDSGPEIARACGLEGKDEWGSGSTGYVNWSSGWADAEGAMIWLREEVEKLNRVKFIVASVKKLLINHTTNTVSGVRLADSTHLTADLTILAAGAWTASLIDLRGICKATGQPICYMPISAAEEARLAPHPTLLNLSTGLFMIPPSNRLLKLARHGHGYLNPTTIPHPESDDPNNTITISLPHTHIDNPAQSVPREAQTQCRAFLTAIHPSLSTPSRPFTKTKICWYADTRDGDFLISYHPVYKNLFVATGGSGHGFKFLPVIGEAIVRCVMGRTPEEFRGRWEWPSERVGEELWRGDGSRGGPVGMVLSEEVARGAGRL